MITKTYLFAILLSVFSVGNALPEPYSSIHVLPFDPRGHFANQDPLFQILSKKKCNIIIEVGTWLGSSARFMAKLQPEDGKLYAVDKWDNLYEDPIDRLQDVPHVFEQFLSNTIHEGLTDKIIPIRMSSAKAAGVLNVSADLIYLDASHVTRNVCDDVLAWLPHLNADGVFCGDDWHSKSVREGVFQAIEKLGVNYVVDGGTGICQGFWMLCRL